MRHSLKFYFLLGWLISITVSTDAYAQTANFNREWRFAIGDHPGAEQSAFNDKGWEHVGIPHSFSMPYFMSKEFYVGYGWYRKTFNLTALELKKRLFLEFDGVFQEAEIFLNGKKIGIHVGGYIGFSVDLTSAAQQGENLLAVRVNNIWHPDVAPRAGEHTFSGGIYRNVRLVAKSAAHIAWYGVETETPDLAKNHGNTSAVSVKTEVCNQDKKSGKYKLVTEIRDAENRVVASAVSSMTVPADSTVTFSQTTTSVQSPRLWSPDSPVLYTAVSSLYKGKKLLDRTETPFGFRWVEWAADKGFFLNGKHLYLQGANVHQDHAGWGDAVTEAGMRRDVEMMKEAGFNFIRGSHYPHAPGFSRACDETGMLFLSEAPFWGIGGFKPDGYWNSSAYPVDEQYEKAFEQSALQQLEEMIRIHRNHPSIIAWSMCNEAFFSAPKAMPGVRRLLKRMVERAHSLDSTRPAAVGGVQRPLGNDRIDTIGDVAGYNGDGATLPDFINPGIPSMVSEYGSVTADRPGPYSPGWGCMSEGDAWKGRDWRSGQAVWCGFDHGSIAGSQLGKMGIVDYFRIPKRAWYWYRNFYRNVAPPAWTKEGTPSQIRLMASKTEGVKADGTDDVHLLVTILDADGHELSNSPKVTLRVVSGPGEFPTGRSITFAPDSDIRIMDGKAAIEFRSYFAGETVIEATSEGLTPSRISIRFEGAPEYVDGVSPMVENRPYTRFTNTAKGEDVLTFGRNNPTFASSSADGHIAGHAADGDAKTYWEASADDTNPYWTLDTEKGLALREVQISFPSAAVYKYKIEASADNTSWFLLSDKTANAETISTARIALKENRKARFVRISFPNAASQQTALAEVVVKGVVVD